MPFRHAGQQGRSLAIRRRQVAGCGMQIGIGGRLWEEVLSRSGRRTIAEWQEEAVRGIWQGIGGRLWDAVPPCRPTGEEPCHLQATCGRMWDANRDRWPSMGWTSAGKRRGFRAARGQEVAGCGIVRPSCRFSAREFARRSGVKRRSLRERWPFMGRKVAKE